MLLPSVLEGHHRSVGPKSLEIVVVTVLVVEHVDHEIDVIEDDPARLSIAFSTGRLDPLELQETALDLSGDGRHLTFGVAAADQEVVGNDKDLRDVQDDDVVRLLVGCRAGGLENESGSLLFIEIG